MINNETNVLEFLGDFCKTHLLSLHDRGFGVKKGNVLYLSLYEAIYLMETKDFKCFDGNKELSIEDLIKRGKSKEKDFFKKYLVFKDLRQRGYVVKSGLKFGSDFRVYDKGGFGKEHSKWVVMVVSERNQFTWNDFSAKNRVAHSTRKRLLIAIIDDEMGISYYEVRWMRM